MTGFRYRAEVVLCNMRVAACGVMQLFAQNLVKRTARDCGNFKNFLNNPDSGQPLKQDERRS